MALEVILTIASVGCSIRGSGTSSTQTSRLPCQVSAFTCASRVGAEARGYPADTAVMPTPALDARTERALGVLLARQRHSWEQGVLAAALDELP